MKCRLGSSCDMHISKYCLITKCWPKLMSGWTSKCHHWSPKWRRGPLPIINNSRSPDRSYRMKKNCVTCDRHLHSSILVRIISGLLKPKTSFWDQEKQRRKMVLVTVYSDLWLTDANLSAIWQWSIQHNPKHVMTNWDSKQKNQRLNSVIKILYHQIICKNKSALKHDEFPKPFPTLPSQLYIKF